MLTEYPKYLIHWLVYVEGGPLTFVSSLHAYGFCTVLFYISRLLLVFLTVIHRLAVLFEDCQSLNLYHVVVTVTTTEL